MLHGPAGGERSRRLVLASEVVLVAAMEHPRWQDSRDRRRPSWTFAGYSQHSLRQTRQELRFSHRSRRSTRLV